MSKIIEKYNKVLDKKGLCALLSKKYALKTGSIQANWFGSGLIPEKYEQSVLKEINKVLEKQKTDLEKTIKL